MQYIATSSQPNYWDPPSFYIDDEKQAITLLQPGLERLNFSLSEARILELGCESGTFVLEFSHRATYVVGTDYSEAALGLARDAVLPNAGGPLEFVASEATQLPFHTRYFDLVIAVDFYEHLPRDVYLSHLSECARILKPRGRLVVFAPAPNHWLEYVRTVDLLLPRDRSHVDVKSMNVYLRTLRQMGFRIERKFLLPTHVPFLNLIERTFMYTRFLGRLFRWRICLALLRE